MQWSRVGLCLWVWGSLPLGPGGVHSLGRHPQWECHGMTESVKVHRKDQSVESFTSKCLFLLFWLILCISLVFLIEI